MQRSISVSILVGLIAVIPLAAIGQQVPAEMPQPNDIAREMFDAFELYCGQAIKDPEGFVASVPDPDPVRHEQSIYRTSDNHVMTGHVFDETENAVVGFHFFATSGGLLIKCRALHLDEEKFPSTYESPWANPNKAEYKQYVQATTEALRNYIHNRTGRTVVGGLLQVRPGGDGIEETYSENHSILTAIIPLGGQEIAVHVRPAGASAEILTSYFRPWP